MSDSVDDATPPPNESNSAPRAIADLREAVVSGEDPGLIDSAAPPSSTDSPDLRSRGGRLQVSESGVADRAAGHPDVNVLDFGADPTGVADSAAAFTEAIASFSPINNSLAGTVIVPFGTYRFASPVRIKKSVWIKGSQPHSRHLSTHIKPDPGIEAFVFERHNTPIGTASAGAGDWAQLSNLIIQPAAKVSNWQPDHTYVAGDTVRTGTAIGEDWRRHYICTTGDTDTKSATSGSGPRSLGNDKILNYDGQTNNFILEKDIVGQASGASGIVIADTDTGAAGQLRLTSVSGTFVDNENLRSPDKLTTYAVANGGSSAASDDEHDDTVRWRYLGSGAGIRVRANGITLRDIGVLMCSGNGIHIEAPEIESPGALANANSWHLQNVDICLNDGHGLYVNGGNSNGGSFLHGVMTTNGGSTSGEDFEGQGFNIYDSSSYGNTYVSIQMDGGGVGSIFADSDGGGSTFIGCYEEGAGGGGENVATSNCVIVGGGLGISRFKPGSTPVCLGVSLQSRGQGHRIVGYEGASWRPGVAVMLGNRRVNGANLYEVIEPGVTASLGGPTEEGRDISDGTAHWAFVHATTRDGAIALGSVDPTLKTFFYVQAPDDMVVGLPTYYRYANVTGVNDAHAYVYGISGPNPVVTEGNGLGLMHAVNKTVLTEWPMKVPAGKALFDQLWLGGCRVMYGTALPPEGTFNPGDRLYYKGTACVPGGAEGLVCTTHGTIGTYTGARTATADGSLSVVIEGAAMSTLIDGQHFKVGDKLTINGTTSRVEKVSPDGLKLLMGNRVATGRGLAITFSPPIFKQFGSIAQ